MAASTTMRILGTCVRSCKSSFVGGGMTMAIFFSARLHLGKRLICALGFVPSLRTAPPAGKDSAPGSRKSRVTLGFEDNASQSGDRLRDADSREQWVVDVDCLAVDLGRERCVVKVEVDAVGICETMRLVLDLIFQVEDYGARIRGRPVTEMPVMRGNLR